MNKFILLISFLIIAISCNQESSEQKKDDLLKRKLDQKNGFREFTLGNSKDSLDSSNLACSDYSTGDEITCRVINYEKYLGPVPIDMLNLVFEENILKRVYFFFPLEGDNFNKVLDIFTEAYGIHESEINEYSNNERYYVWKGKNTTINIFPNFSDRSFLVQFSSKEANDLIDEIKDEKYSKKYQKEGNKVNL